MTTQHNPASSAPGNSHLCQQPPIHGPSRAYVLAWGLCVVFYFIQYAMRSAPGVMLPELQLSLALPRGSVTSIIGLYFYSYALVSLLSGIVLDRLGPRRVVPAGILCVAVGALLFSFATLGSATAGRLLQGAGSGVAFTGAVYLASRGFSKARLATAVGMTQCIGMLGGSLGQSLVGPLIHHLAQWQVFWHVSAFLLAFIALSLWWFTPHAPAATTCATAPRYSVLGAYGVVIKNRQSWLCGLISGLMFLPTNIGDMIWGLPFLQGRGLEDDTALLQVSMIPLGWVIGCPLFGYLSDRLGRRKPVLMAGIVLLLASGTAWLTLPMAPILLAATGLVVGIASGTAMLPYTIIKETNPDEVKGTATGAMNFLVFFSSALMTPVFASLINGLSNGLEPATSTFLQADLLFGGGLVMAALLSLGLKETGYAGKKTAARELTVQKC